MTLWADLAPWQAVSLGLVAAVAIVLLVGTLWPYVGLRMLMAVLSRSAFWLRVGGRQHLPASGPVLLVANSVGHLGWLFFLAACPRRVRFLVLAGWTRHGLVGWRLRRAGAITPGPDDTSAEPALARAREALARGEVVCLFAEGCTAPDGQTLRFSQLYERLVGIGQLGGRNAPRPPAVPVVPVCLHQPNGSVFSMHKGQFIRRIPADLPSPVWVSFGEPLPPGTDAAHARQALQELSARLAVERGPWRRPVHRQFVRTAARHPFRLCWVDSTAPGQDMTYAKAYVGTVCLAEVLRPILTDEPMVAVWLPPGRGGALANLALAVLGKTSVNLNYTAGPESIRSALRQCDCKHVLTARRFTDRLPLDPGPGVELVYLEDLLPKVSKGRKLRSLLSVLLLPGWFLERVALGLTRHTVEQLATVIFSSGSTGEPKGVMLTHGNIAANAESIVQATCLSKDDRLLGVLPFFHSFGYTVTLWAPLQIGAAAVYHADPRQAREIGELCGKHGCTLYVTTATFLRFCLRKCEPDDFRTLRILMCGAEKLPPPLADEFERRFGVRPLEGYGCTELSPASAANMPDQPYGGWVQVHNKTGTVGPPLPGCAARVVHPETGEALPLGEEGLLLQTGANVMLGYLHKPDLTRQVIRDGWYVTGDMARVDADGYVTLTGRLSRFAKIGGEMVPLERVEEALHDALGTSERVCAVTCVPDEARGERVVVLYLEAMLAQFDVQVRPWCGRLPERGLPNLWVPAERDFFAVAELPILGSGKVNLKEVKDLALALVKK
jgi:acyl-[acyl-carrier-protein]-phospholipid O-acyltransferase/long-chain-fatty-acid--[acyl-carrier-protein] ligase